MGRREGEREGGKTDEEEGGKRLPCSLCGSSSPSKGVSPQTGLSKGDPKGNFPGPPLTKKDPSVRFSALPPAENPTVPQGLKRADTHCNLSLAAGPHTT